MTRALISRIFYFLHLLCDALFPLYKRGIKLNMIIAFQLNRPKLI